MSGGNRVERKERSALPKTSPLKPLQRSPARQEAVTAGEIKTGRQLCGCAVFKAAAALVIKAFSDSNHSRALSKDRALEWSGRTKLYGDFLRQEAVFRQLSCVLATTKIVMI